MFIPAHSEIYYSEFVERQLIGCGWHARSTEDYDQNSGLVLSDLLAFLEATQPGHLTGVGYKRLASDIRHAICKAGAAHAFKHGIMLDGNHIRLCGFKPQFQATRDSRNNDHLHNRFTVIRELQFNSLHQRLDLALFLNGIPLFTFELKSELSTQTAADAMEQYRRDRNPATSILLEPVTGALAHFAVSQDEAAFTTRLQGDETVFVPFDPTYDYVRPQEHSYKTDYLWRQVLLPENVLQLLEYFILQRVGQSGLEVLFPRFHQWDCVQKLRADVTGNGVGRRYLQQHSTGSGKSFTIAWLAFQLAFLATQEYRRIFDKIIVVTDRIVLDRQLGDVLTFMQGSEIGQLVKCEKTRDLLEALQSKTPIIVTTIQKFGWLQTVLDREPRQKIDPGALARIRGLHMAVIIDEAHSSQGGALFQSMLRYLTAHRNAGRNTPNLSFFAFTATPRPETLEIFGSKNRTGELEPFHSYSMQQAIDEGYILDVRKGYKTMDIHYQVESLKPGIVVTNRDEVLKQIHEDETSIKAKARKIARIFNQGVAPQLEGEAQAMVVCSSRKAVGLFKTALDEVMQQEMFSFGTIAAFTDEIMSNGRMHDECSINGLRAGTDLGRLFRDNPKDFRILIVADKFQLGFDCPRLTALFVDKRLDDISAVQTLSRLNRAFPRKDSTLVIDFVNDEETIMKAFSRYIKPLSTTPHNVLPRLAELSKNILGYGAFGNSEIEEHWRVFRANPQALYGLVEPIKATCAQRGMGWQRELIALLREFRELYTFGVKVQPEAGKYQHLAVFAITLLRYLDKAEIQKSARLPLKVVMATVVPFTDEKEAEPAAEAVRIANAGATESPEAKALLDRLLLDLSREKLQGLADELHEIIERLSADEEVRNQAANNSFDIFVQEGIAAIKLNQIVIDKIITGKPYGQALFDVTQRDDPAAMETRENILRVVYLRHPAANVRS